MVIHLGGYNNVENSTKEQCRKFQLPYILAYKSRNLGQNNTSKLAIRLMWVMICSNILQVQTMKQNEIVAFHQPSHKINLIFNFIV